MAGSSARTAALISSDPVAMVTYLPYQSNISRILP